jgi:hypothetical protein
MAVLCNVILQRGNVVEVETRRLPTQTTVAKRFIFTVHTRDQTDLPV